MKVKETSQYLESVVQARENYHNVIESNQQQSEK